MTTLVFLVEIATAAMVLVLGIKLRGWLGAMRRDLDQIRSEFQLLQTRDERTANELKSLLAQSTAESVNASCMTSFAFRFPVFLGGPSIDANHARLLMFLLQEKKPKTVLELGSGSSTLIISRALEALGCPANLHIAVDHEARFLGNTEQIARANGVADGVRFEHCPLAPVEGFSLPWYSRIPEIVGNTKLDLVVIDGPPAYAAGEGRAREPALAVLRPLLAEGAIVVLDDANRPGETDVVESWIKRFPEFSLQRFSDGKGVAVLTLGGGD